MITTTLILNKWLRERDLLLLTCIKPAGCSGYELDWKLIPNPDPRVWRPVLYHANDSMSHVKLEAELDYISTALFEGIHINYKNKDLCGCGKSFS